MQSNVCGGIGLRTAQPRRTLPSPAMRLSPVFVLPAELVRCFDEVLLELDRVPLVGDWVAPLALDDAIRALRVGLEAPRVV